MILVTIEENSENINLSVENGDAPIVLEVNESRDAYQLAVANGFSGSQSDWLFLTTGTLNSSLLSGKGYLVTASASGQAMGLAPDQSGYALLYDPSQVGGLRWGEVQGGGAGSGITSFNGRDGVVVSISGDYSDSLITNTSTITGGTVKNALDSVDLRLKSTGSTLNTLANQISGELNFYSTGRDTVLTNNLQSTGSNLLGLLRNATGELGLRVENTGSSLFQLNSNTSGALNYYLTGSEASLSNRIESTGSSLDTRITNLGAGVENTGSNLFNLANTISGELNAVDASLSTRIQDTGINLYNLLVNESGSFEARLKSSGESLINLNTATSGEINFYLTGSNAGLSTRIDNSGSLFINGSGQLNFDITGLSFRLEQTGSATVNTVNSVFGRQGVIIQQSGDYSNTGITNQSNVVGATTADALNTLDQRLTSSGSFGGGGSVSSVFGRIGAVISQSGDYADTGITNTSSIDGGSVFHALNSIHSRINNSGGLLINLSGEFDNKLQATGSSLFNFTNTVSGELNFYLTGADSALSTRIGNTGASLYGLIINSSGEFNTKIENTGIALSSLNSSTSGAINFYLTGSDASLSTRIDNSGSLFINGSGELSNRIASTGSTLNTFINTVSGELNFYYTGADNTLSSRIESTGSLLPNVSLNSSLTGVLEITGQTLYGKDPNADRIPFWDNSEKRLSYLSAGNGLAITGSIIEATGSAAHDSVTLNATLTGVLSLAGQEISANDLGSDKLWFWDDSDGIMKPLTIGTGLTITDTTIAAAGGGTGWTYIDGGTVSSVGSVIEDGIFTDTYDEYQLVLFDVRTGTNSVMWHVRLRASGADITDTYNAAYHGRTVGGTAVDGQGPNDNTGWRILGSDGTGTNHSCNAVFNFYPRLGIEQRMTFQSIGRTYLDVETFWVGGGMIVDYTTDVDGFKILPQFGSYNVSLTWKLFGR